MKNTPSSPSVFMPSSGFTLIELLITMAIGVVMLFATLSIFDSTNSAMAKLTRTNEVFQNGVFAFHTLQDDVALAGFYGEGAIPATLPGSAPDACSTTPADWQTALRVPVQTWLSGAADKPTCVPASSSLVTNSSIIAIRRASTCTIGSANCASGSNDTPMVQVSECDTDVAQALTGTTTASLTLKGSKCAAVAPIRQYYTRIYYLDKNNVGSDGIPTLKRVDLGIGGFTTVTVAQGVEQMRLVYGIDSAGNDGVVDSWSSSPGSADWPNIVAVKINLLVKGSIAETQYSNTKAYQVGDLAVAAANDGYHRNLVSALVRIVNVAGPRE